MLILGIFSFIGDSVKEMIVGVFLLIDSLVYSIISWLYQIFCILASFRLFESELFDVITSSIFSIIGVVALFIIAYQLLKYMINPEDVKGGAAIKKIVIKIITSMAMIILVPMLFDFLFDFQNSILSNNTIGKLILPTYNSSELENVLGEMGVDNPENISEEDYNYYLLQYYGNSTATQIFQAFFYPTGANISTFSNAADSIETEGDGSGWLVDIVAYGTCGLGIAAAAGVSFATALIGSPSFGAAAAYCASALVINEASDIISDLTSAKYSLSLAYTHSAMYGDFNVFQPFAKNIIENEITYHYLLSTIVGVVVAYILAIYCLDLGVRAVKLAVYQIVAPIPIFLRILPNQEKVFNNWWKAVLSTYTEIFMRMLILYFGVLFISNLPGIIGNIFSSDSTPYADNLLIYLLVRTVIILGILIFIKQAPKIIEEVTGIKSGNFSFNIMDHIKDAAWAPSAVGGLIAGHGNPLAMLRAGRAGWKNNNLQGIGGEVTRRRNLEEARRDGSRWYGRMLERGRNYLGLETGTEYINRRMEEGINPETGRNYNATNDTANAINIRDENGTVVRTIIVGQTVDMDKGMQEHILTSKQFNIKELSDISEIVRHISDSEKSNERIIAFRSAIKKEAEEKVLEEKSDVEDTIRTSSGKTFTGNLASMYEFREKMKLSGASEDELKEITKEIGLAKERMWKVFADAAITGNPLANGKSVDSVKIKSISEQLELLYAQNGLQQGAGIDYDKTIDAKGLNGLSGIALVEALDKAAKDFNTSLVKDKQTEEHRRAIIQEQNTGLDRLTAQLKEQQEITKRSDRYRATEANVKNINGSGKRS